jgi:hypothetical protein
MPAATAEILGIVILGIVIALVLRLLITGRLISRARPSPASKGTDSRPSLIRRLKPSAVLHLRRRPTSS